MGNLDIRNTTTSNLTSGVSDYSLDSKTTDGSTGNGETYYDNPYFSKWYGYYRSIPELKSAVNALATWVLGQGFVVQSARDKVILEHITGSGEDTFNSILWNMLVVKKINGDAYAEIVMKNDILQNLKPLDPSSMRSVFNPQGRIIRYEQTSKSKEIKKFKPEEIFHLMNDRVADETHGISGIEAVQWVIDAMMEAEADWRRISHRATIRVLYIDEDDTTKLTTMKTSYKDAISKGELLILPCKAGEAQFADLTLPPIDAFMRWLGYLENKFYRAFGVPKVILGGTAENTEASAKVSVIVFDPTFTREITELEADIWNQLGIKITINKQPSLMDNAQTDESKNKEQTGFQQNDVTAGSGK